MYMMSMHANEWVSDRVKERGMRKRKKCLGRCDVITLYSPRLSRMDAVSFCESSRRQSAVAGQG